MVARIVAEHLPRYPYRLPFRFEIDPVNQVLLLRVDGRLTDESVPPIYRAIREYSTATDARAGIWDLSATEFALSPEFICQLATLEPAMPDAAQRPRFVVVPAEFGLSVSRMFEIAVEHKRPLLKIASTIDEALGALGIRSPQFEPLA